MNKFTKIEKKWQKIWSDEKCFESKKNKKPIKPKKAINKTC